MSIFKFFRKKPKPVVSEQFLPATPTQAEETFREPTSEEVRIKVEERFQECLHKRDIANGYYFFVKRMLVEALLYEALSKTDDDDTTNTSTLSTQN